MAQELIALDVSARVIEALRRSPSDADVVLGPALWFDRHAYLDEASDGLEHGVERVRARSERFADQLEERKRSDWSVIESLGLGREDFGAHARIGWPVRWLIVIDSEPIRRLLGHPSDQLSATPSPPGMWARMRGWLGSRNAPSTVEEEPAFAIGPSDIAPIVSAIDAMSPSEIVAAHEAGYASMCARSPSWAGVAEPLALDDHEGALLKPIGQLLSVARSARDRGGWYLTRTG